VTADIRRTHIHGAARCGLPLGFFQPGSAVAATLLLCPLYKMPTRRRVQPAVMIQKYDIMPAKTCKHRQKGLSSSPEPDQAGSEILKLITINQVLSNRIAL